MVGHSLWIGKGYSTRPRAIVISQSTEKKTHASTKPAATELGAENTFDPGEAHIKADQ